MLPHSDMKLQGLQELHILIWTFRLFWRYICLGRMKFEAWFIIFKCGIWISICTVTLSQAKRRGLTTNWNSWGACLDFGSLRLCTAGPNWEAGWDLLLGTQVYLTQQPAVENAKLGEVPLSIRSHWFLEEVTRLKVFNMSCIFHLQIKLINILVVIKTPFW